MLTRLSTLNLSDNIARCPVEKEKVETHTVLSSRRPEIVFTRHQSFPETKALLLCLNVLKHHQHFVAKVKQSNLDPVRQTVDD